MPRRSTGPRYYRSRKAYYATINKETVKLCNGPRNAENDALAQEKYRRLAAVKATEQEGDRAECGAVLGRYLRDARTRVSPPPLAPTTYRMHRQAIQSFVRFEHQSAPLGTVPMRDLKMEHVQGWVAAGRAGQLHGKPWKDTYCNMQLRILRTAFRWAMNEGELISQSPFERRGRKARIGAPDLSLKRPAVTDEEHAHLLAQSRRRTKSSFALLLEVLYETGARPAEVYKARPEEWKPELKAFVLDPADPRSIGRLKNRRHLRKQGRKRVIRVPSHLVEPLTELASRFPEGLEMFRTEKGTAWKDAATIAWRFRSLIRATNKLRGQGRQVVRPGVSLYSYRHAYVSRFLKGGGSPMLLCELLNTSLEMLQTHYSHLFEEHGQLLDAVERFSSRGQRCPQGDGSGNVKAVAS
jgi:integrase